MVNEPAAGAKTLDNGLRVLEAVAAHPGGLTVTELGREVGLHRTVTWRLLQTLTAHALVVADDGRYRMGLAAVDLAAAVRLDLRSAARLPLRTLAEATGATAHLTVLDGEEAVSIAVVEPFSATAHVAYRSGTRHRLDQGAAGLAILLGRPPADGERQRVRRARRAGFVASSGEIQAGAWGLAAPVAHRAGEPATASVGVVALAPLDEAVVSRAVLAAAAEIGAAAGR